jgi:ketosteroid isomerase-like protein
MPDNAVSEIADVYFEAWQAGDFARLRSILADDATFDGPLGQARNADECIAGLQRMSQVMTGIGIRKTFVDGPDVLTRVGLPHGRIHYDDALLADGE